MRAIALLILLTPLWVAPALADKLDFLPGIAPADHTRFVSEATGRPYHIFVRLPLDYDETEQSYPTVYALDGDLLFPILGANHYLLSFDEETVPEAIVVGIAYGTFDPENGNYRTVDYSTPPLPPEFRQGVDDGGADGGAAKFQKFISDELIPMIEGKYRADPARRILIGQSRGAHFVLYSAYTQPDLFWGRIASNPSLKPGEDLFFGDLSEIPSSNSHLFFSSGERDIERLRKEALALFDHLSKQERTPWRLRTKTMENETHATGVTNVYRDAMKWFFTDEGRDDEARD